MPSATHKDINTCYNHHFIYNNQTCNISISSASDSSSRKSTCTNSSSMSPSSPSLASSPSSSSSSSSSLSSFASEPPKMIMIQSSLFVETCDVVQNMMKQELETYYNPTKSHFTRNDPWRQVMIQWICTIVEAFELSNQIVSVSVYYLDVSIAKRLVESSEDYKLVTLTALQMAIKIYDYKLFPLEQLLSVSNTNITVKDVSEMEQRMITALDWMLHPPTFDCFVYQYCSILATCGQIPLTERGIVRIERKAEELSRIPLLNEPIRTYRPSMIAYAAILLAMDRLLQRFQMAKIRQFTKKMSHATNITAMSDGFEEVFNILAFHMDCDGSGTSSSMQCTNSYETKTTASKVHQDEDASTTSPCPYRARRPGETNTKSPCNVSKAM